MMDTLPYPASEVYSDAHYAGQRRYRSVITVFAVQQVGVGAR